MTIPKIKVAADECSPTTVHAGTVQLLSCQRKVYVPPPTVPRSVRQYNTTYQTEKCFCHTSRRKEGSVSRLERLWILLLNICLCSCHIAPARPESPIEHANRRGGAQLRREELARDRVASAGRRSMLLPSRSISFYRFDGPFSPRNRLNCFSESVTGDSIGMARYGRTEFSLTSGPCV